MNAERLRAATLWLVVLATASLPMETSYEVPRLGSLTRIFSVLAAVTWAALAFRTGRVRRPHPVHTAMLLFVLWDATSMLWTYDGPGTEERTLTYAQLMVFSLVVWEVVTTLRTLRLVLQASLAGCVVSAVLIIGGFLLDPSGVELHGRVTVAGFNPNDAGLILALALPVALYLLSHPSGAGAPRAIEKAVTIGFLPFGTFAVLLTGSRAALAAVVPAAWYGGWLLWQRRPALALGSAAGAVVLTLAALPLLPTAAFDRLNATGADLLQGNLNERQDVWGEAFRLIREHPLLGVGSGAFRTAAVGVNKVGHNIVLGLLAEVGPLGLALFVAILVITVRALGTAPRQLRALMYTQGVGWLFAAMLHNWEYRKMTWLMLTLMVAAGRLGMRRAPAAVTHHTVVRMPEPLTRGTTHERHT